MGAEWGVREVEVGKNPTGGGSMRCCALVNWWRILPSWLFWRAVLVAISLGDQGFVRPGCGEVVMLVFIITVR